VYTYIHTYKHTYIQAYTHTHIQVRALHSDLTKALVTMAPDIGGVPSWLSQHLADDDDLHTPAKDYIHTQTQSPKSYSEDIGKQHKRVHVGHMVCMYMLATWCACICWPHGVHVYVGPCTHACEDTGKLLVEDKSYVFVRVCIRACMYHMYSCVYVWKICACMSAGVHVTLDVFVLHYVHTHVHAYPCTYTCTCIPLYIHTVFHSPILHSDAYQGNESRDQRICPCVCTCMLHAYTHICTYETVHGTPRSTYMPCLHIRFICMYVCMYVYIYIYTHTYTHIHSLYGTDEGISRPPCAQGRMHECIK
jgi:hypothetical protein